jgi:hypothetical protein
MIACKDDTKHRQWRRELVLIRLTRRNRRRDIAKRIEGCSVALFRNQSGRSIIVHRSTRTDRDGDWQVTSWDEHGPSGHHCAPTFAEGCFRAGGASRESYWNSHGYELIEAK